MTNYAVYDTATGRIARVGTSSSPDVSGKAGSGQTAMICDADQDADYILNGAVTARPVPDLSALSSATAGVAVTMSGLADGATVTATPGNGTEESDTVAADGLMSITFTSAGPYVVTVSEVFPHLSVSATVEVS